MFENAFNNIDKVLRKEEGVSSELDYAEQTSWVLFLKYLDDLECQLQDEAELEGRDHKPILPDHLRWAAWAAPKVDGKPDPDAMTGDDLIEFVNLTLFPELKKFRDDAAGPDTLDYKIGEIFSELTSKFRSGYSLRDVLEIIDGLSFNSQAEKHELSDLYESRIKRMGNAGRNGGEYYTPRPLIRAMIKVVDPKIGETVYDGACGSAGFLCEAYEYLMTPDISASDYNTLQTKTFYGQEKKSLAYIIAIMNMILHGINTPNITRGNTLNENVMDIQEKDRHDVILANPPFGGGERAEVQQNFPIKSGETAYLFLQHFIRKLRAGGRAAIVIKNTFLSNGDAAALRKELLDTCNLHTVLDCPAKVFQGAGVKTVVLFFEKGRKTHRTWYYALDPERSLGKTAPLRDDELEDFLTLQATQGDSAKSWTVERDAIDAETFDMSVKNPITPEEDPLRDPETIIEDILTRDAETAQILADIRGML